MLIDLQVCYTDPDGQDLSDEVKTAELASSESGTRDQDTNGFGNNLAVPRNGDVITDKCEKISLQFWYFLWRHFMNRLFVI